MKINPAMIEIDASAEQVFLWLHESERLKLWVPNLIEDEILSETDNKVGSTFRQVYLEQGRRTEMKGTVTVYQPNRRINCEIKGDVFDHRTLRRQSGGSGQ